MIYFTSDPHVFHRNIIQYDSLPFSSLEDYRSFFVKIWNDTITDNDDVYLLGDTCVGGTTSQIQYFIQSLKGNKYLIKGNHEKEIMKKETLRNLFIWIKRTFISLFYFSDYILKLKSLLL